MSKSNRVYALVPNTPTQSAKPPPSNWQTGICECFGQNQCCAECCLVAVGLDFLMYKDTDEMYIERERGLKHDSKRKFVPDPGTLEAFIGGLLCRGLGVLATCGAAAGTGGLFDLFWCHTLASQRRQVRDMYNIDGSPCCDCFVACCCRCCMFNQMKHQFEVDNPTPPDPGKPQQVNSMPWDGKYKKNSRWISDKTFENPPNGPVKGEPYQREYV